MSNNNMTLTDNAAKKLTALKAAEGNQDLMLRVYVTGCNLFKWRCNVGGR